MKEKGIIFSEPMVRAILENRKTQTRRVITHRDNEIQEAERVTLRNDGKWQFYQPGAKAPWLRINSPYKPGDILYVRETYAKHDDIKGYLYKATASEFEDNLVKWRPSRYMPRSAARIFLRVTDVRVERVKDISGRDACAEGIEIKKFGNRKHDFEELWDSLNAKRGYSWDSNPWCWVYEFERVDADTFKEGLKEGLQEAGQYAAL